MTVDGAYEKLLSPLNIRGSRLRNRVVTTGHSVAAPYALDGSADSFIEYCRRRAEGGVGMIITMPVVVDPLPTGWPNQVADRVAALADAVHGEGGTIVTQLVNFGGQIGSQVNHDGRPMWSFNGRQDEFGEASHRMTSAEIQTIIDSFAHTAKVVTEAGLDGVELHGGHGYIFHQSYSPWGNGRDDEWGDPLAFSQVTIAAVRAAMGPNKILGFRFTASDDLRVDEGHQSDAELAEIAVGIVDTGEIDYLNPTIGTKAPAYSQKSVAGYRYRDGFDLDFAASLRKAVDARTLVIGVGGIVDPRMGEAALRDEKCDLVGMTRGNMADPDMVKKLMAGDAKRIRPCVRAAECNDRRVDGKQVACMHNPEVLREKFFARSETPSQTARTIVVVGAGPAGLKAAQAAALRGHSVRVIDAGSEPGGRLRYVRATAARRLFGSVDWLMSELDVAGVPVEFNRRVSAEDVVALDADEIVLAIGAVPDASRAFSFDDPSRVLTVEAALDHTPDGENIMVLDRTGLVEVALAAETLGRKGKQITYVTHFERMATNAGYTNRLDLRDLWRRTDNLHFIVDVDISRYENGIVSLINPDGDVIHELAMDYVVAGVHPTPDGTLAAALSAAGRNFTMIGDALAPRGTTASIREGAIFALELT